MSNDVTSAKVVLVGCGNMGRAMLAGWMDAGALTKQEVVVVEPSPALRQLVEAMDVTCCESAADLPENLKPTLVIFAVKPQVMFDVTPAYRTYIEYGAAVLSVAAGLGTEKFAREFGAETPIIRVMPNTPAAVSKGMMVIFNNDHVNVSQKQLVESLMAASGEIAIIEDEKLMDAVTAVSGSGPAYVFHMMEALTAAGEDAGLPKQIAKLLAEQTVYGAAIYAKQSDQDPGTLRTQVTSPNGTTAAALEVLMGNDALKSLMSKAVAAAKKRSEELS